MIITLVGALILVRYTYGIEAVLASIIDKDLAARLRGVASEILRDIGILEIDGKPVTVGIRILITYVIRVNRIPREGRSAAVFLEFKVVGFAIVILLEAADRAVICDPDLPFAVFDKEFQLNGGLCIGQRGVFGRLEAEFGIRAVFEAIYFGLDDFFIRDPCLGLIKKDAVFKQIQHIPVFIRVRITVTGFADIHGPNELRCSFDV